MTASTAWRENVLPSEEKDFAEATERLVAMQAGRSARLGPGRALHRKQVLGLAARLEVLGGLPDHGAHGVFAAPKTFEAWVRLSNGSMDVQRDKTPDIRGFAIKVLGVNGPGALGSPTTAQDFLLIDRPVTGFTRPEEFFGVVLAAAKGPLAVIWHLIRTQGFGGGLARLKALQAGQKRPFHGFASTVFHSAAPIAMGPFAARVRLSPDAPGAPAASADDWRADLSGRLAGGALTFSLALQFFVNETVTPIEDGARDWDESAAPYVTVARLTVQPPGSATETEARDKEIEAARFDPWCALEAHRPLGAIMRARKVAYFGSQKGRGLG